MSCQAGLDEITWMQGGRGLQNSAFLAFEFLEQTNTPHQSTTLNIQTSWRILVRSVWYPSPNIVFICFCGMLVDILKHVKFLVMFGFHGHANQLYCMTVLFLDVDHAFVSFQQHTESSAPRLRLTKWCKMSGLRWVISSEAILQSLPLPPPRGILRAFSKGGQCPCHMVHLIMVIYGDLWWWIWFIVVYDTCMVIDLDQRSMNFWGPCCWLSTISICSLALTENGVSLRSLLFMLLSAFCTNCWILIVKLHSLWIIAILFIGSMTDARTEVSEILWSASKSYQEWNSAVLFSVANLSCPGLWVHDKVLIRAEFRLQSLSTNSEIHFFDSALDHSLNICRYRIYSINIGVVQLCFCWRPGKWPRRI